MLQTQLGEKIKGWTISAKSEMKADLEKLTKVPPEILRGLVNKIARTYPTCNVNELAALEAEQRGMSNPRDLTDAMSAFSYLWGNINAAEPSGALIADLTSLELLSAPTAQLLTELFKSSEQFREVSKIAATYTRLGASLFVAIHGTVDIRLRFHDVFEEFTAGTLPEKIVGMQPVIMTNMTLNKADGEEIVVPFLMDEDDLKYMKKFVRNMERELELSKAVART